MATRAIGPALFGRYVKGIEEYEATLESDVGSDLVRLRSTGLHGPEPMGSRPSSAPRTRSLCRLEAEGTNDRARATIAIMASMPPKGSRRLRVAGSGHAIGTSSGRRALLVRDPDGHAILLAD